MAENKKTTVTINIKNDDRKMFLNVLEYPNVQSKILGGLSKSIVELVKSELERVGLKPGKSESGMCIQKKINELAKKQTEVWSKLVDAAVDPLNNLIEEEAKKAVAKVVKSKEYKNGDNQVKKSLILKAIAETSKNAVKKAFTSPKKDILKPFKNYSEFVKSASEGYATFGEKNKKPSPVKFVEGVAVKAVKECMNNDQDKIKDVKAKLSKRQSDIDKAFRNIFNETSRRLKGIAESVGELSEEVILKTGDITFKEGENSVKIDLSTNPRRYAYSYKDIVNKKIEVSTEEEEAKTLDKSKVRYIYEVVKGSASALVYGLISVVVTSIVFLVFKIPFTYLINPKKWKNIFLAIAKSDKHIALKVVGIILLLIGVAAAAVAIYKGAKAFITILIDKIKNRGAAK